MNAFVPLSLLVCLLVNDSPRSVDLELVLATDVSVSMDGDERRAQLAGYARAFRDPAVVAQIMQGSNGRIAVAYVEWSSEGHQTVSVPWRLIDSPEACASLASAIEQIEVTLGFGPTAIGSALSFSARLLDDNRYAGARRVIDVSGDGESNVGPEVDAIRDALVRRGISINGLAMSFDNDRGSASRSFVLHSLNDPMIGAYYREHVIGGISSFVHAVTDPDDFASALRLKLIREIAGRPQPRMANELSPPLGVEGWQGAMSARKGS